jgi:dipeptidyl aminopeptidase/acylaminoacyl peptidase
LAIVRPMKHTPLRLYVFFAAALQTACGAAPAPTPETPASPPAPVAPVSWAPRSGPSLEQLMNVHRATSPSPSADGRTVAFLSDATGVAQPFAVDVGPQPVAEPAWRRLASDPERVQAVDLAPDGRSLFLWRDKGGNENTQLLRGDAAGGALTDLTQAPDVRHNRGPFSADGSLLAYASNARDRAHFDLYVRPVQGEGGAPRLVFQGEGQNGPEDFSPDARFLAALHERSNFDQDVLLVDLEKATARVLTPHPAGVDVRFQSARFTPDGRSLFVTSDAGREFMNVALLPVDRPTAAPRFVIEMPHDVDALELSPDGRTLALVANVDGYSEVGLYDVTDPAAPKPLPRPEVPRGVVTGLVFARDGGALYFGLSQAMSPDEIHRLDLATRRTTRLTAGDRAGVDTSRLVDATVERVKSFDGLEVPVLLYRPADLRPGERAPVIVSVHGGPEAQATAYFSPVVQLLVGRGYIVAAPNVRGSTGYGKRYSHLDDVALREDSVKDLAAVNRWLRARPDVAPERIAVMGGSYGGYMVLAALTLDPDLWAAGCDTVGIANFRTFLEKTAPYRRALREAEYGSLVRDGELLDRLSPLHKVDRIRAPLMVIHGTNDPRVPVYEAEQIVDALKKRGQRVEFLKFDNEGHGIARRENRLKAYGDMLRFFDETIGRVTP